MKEKMHNASDDDWRPIVEAAFQHCTSEMQSKIHAKLGITVFIFLYIKKRKG